MSDQYPPDGPAPRPGQVRPWLPPDRQNPSRPTDTGIRDIDPVFPAGSLLHDHGARVLDPVTAVRPRGDVRRLRPTVYVGDTLLVPDDLVDRLGGPLSEAARPFGLEPVLDERDRYRAGLLARAGAGTPTVVRIRLQPIGPPVDVDAWAVLQSLRGGAPVDLQPELPRIGLNHLLGGGWPSMQGTPVLPGHDGGPLSEYAQPGRGARSPVAYVGHPPVRREKSRTRRPVVAVLDTGVGNHPWLDGLVRRGVDLDGESAGLPPTVPDPELRGDVAGPLDGVLDSHSGHGTFICGLVRQLAPDADVLAVRVMHSDGIVEEADLVWALSVLDARLARTQAGKAKDGHLDVVVLSLGYYHESPLLPFDDSVLREVLASLGRRGVAVVCAAGNDATLRPMYPAAFTPHPGGLADDVEADEVPLLSVGGLNPDGSVALFSNSGPWVTTWDTGAALVSTFPVTFDGGAAASVQTADPSGQPRRTIDPDCYVGGFGTWSGTSFAAPVLAARIAAELGEANLDEAGVASAVARARAAITARTGLDLP
ncbi:MAG TPA: S8 family serine peptidase [Pseudonocardiaceae bacterium]